MKNSYRRGLARDHSPNHLLRVSVPLWFLCSALLLLIGCGQSGEAADNGAERDPDQPIRIVATTGMIGDVVENIAQDRAEVTILMGSDTDPHLYRPTRSDVQKLLNADLVFYNGLNLEGRMTDTFVKVARSGKPVHAVTELIEETYLLDDDEYDNAHDPHVWMDPRGWIKAAEAIEKVLSEFDPDYAAVYKERAETYLEELRALDAYVRSIMETVPSGRRVLVTAHDAFQYFARAYDLEVQAIQGISTDSEAGLRRIEELVNMLVEREITAVFTETTVPDRHVKTLIEGAQARGHTIAIGGELFSDAMGAAGTYEGSYIGMIDHNVTTIVRALGGETPERGFQSKLSK